jgi:hypothetical protein
MQVHATLTVVETTFEYQHPRDGARVDAIVARCRRDTGVEWDLPPVVVVESDGGLHLILDGHHRCEAATKLRLSQIPAWVVSLPDMCKIETPYLEEGGQPTPWEIREHIMCGDVTANQITAHGENVLDADFARRSKGDEKKS